jgi:hypothetical protein
VPSRGWLVGVWLSLYGSTTMLVARVAYWSSRRTHSYSFDRQPLPGGEDARVEGHEHRIQGRRGGLPGALGGRVDGPLAAKGL